MKKLNGVFAVSFIAMMTVATAFANIASQGYVDQEVGSKLSAITGSTTGSGNVVTSVTASGGTVTATRGITAEVATNKVKTIRGTSTATDTAYPSEKAVATALAGKADIGDIPSEFVLKAATSDALGGVKSGGDITVNTSGVVTVGHATKADSATSASSATTATSATKATQDASGNVITTTYATKTELSAVEDKADAAQSAAASASSTASAAQTAANSKVAKAQGSAAANKVLITDGSGNVTTGTVSSAMITDGTIANADISASAAISQSKISGLTTALAAKANTEDLAEVATSGSYNDLTDKPSIPAAITVDSALSSTSTNPVQNKVINTALAGKLATTGTAAKATADASGNVITTTYATKTELGGKVATAQGSGNANKAVITNASGNITTGTITSAMITDGTITNADIADGAAIAQSKVSGLTTDLAAKATKTELGNYALKSSLKTVATTGSYNDLTDKPSIPSAYVLKAATAEALGGVKSGGDITVGTDGTVTVAHAAKADTATSATSATTATTATSATKATQDASGNVITTTYATKAQLSALDSTSSGTGALVTDVSQTDGKVTVTKGNVKIPIGSADGTTYATIWVE